MTRKTILSLSLTSAVVLGLCNSAIGAVPVGQTIQAIAEVSADADPLTPQQRGELTRQLVLKWGDYVEKVHGVPVRTWANRMVPTLVQADSTNFRHAMQRDTFEGAMAELIGNGQKITDEGVISKLAFSDGDGTQVLGALANDLVFTPVLPCRILDTRVAGGVIPADGSRDFVAFGAVNFTGQGGSATDCGVGSLNASAVAINLTAVTPTGAGFATVYPFNTTKPLAASVNYTAGAIVNNALIVQTPSPALSKDFTVYTFAQSHYVADIVGYFAPPAATALQCVQTAGTVISINPGATVSAVAPACAAGFSMTATNCVTSTGQMPLMGASEGICTARNNGASAASLRASRTCCRVPGR